MAIRLELPKITAGHVKPHPYEYKGRGEILLHQ